MSKDVSEDLSPALRKIAEGAESVRARYAHGELGRNHWIAACLERNGAMAESLYPEINASAAAADAREALNRGDAGEALPVSDVAAKAAEYAALEQRSTVAERHILMALYGPAEAAHTSAPASETAGPRPGSRPNPFTKSTAPTLCRFGRDLTSAASAGKLMPVFGREDVIESMIETICRPTKRNPVLIGPAGTGKTTIVEGLARRIAEGRVPEILKASRIYAISLSDLLAGSDLSTFLGRLNDVLAEAQQPGVILFIDEMHSLTAGIAPGLVTTALKPALARGDFCCIAATTDNEYRVHIEPDKALERRFQPIRVQELTPRDTLEVLKLRRDALRSLRDVAVDDNVLEWIVQFSGDYLKNRVFPDKAVDLLEQSIGHGVASGIGQINLETARAVAERLVGVPLHPKEALEKLDADLAATRLLDDEDRASLMARLGVTVRGLDLSPHRPTAVVLLGGEHASRDSALAQLIARDLFGSADRVVTIDFGRFTEDHDISALLGSPPGYVGHMESLPIHSVAQMPWCVLICRNIDMCHLQILGVLRQGLASGFLTDSGGKRIYLSDAVVILTAQTMLSSEPERHVGLRSSIANGDASEVELPDWMSMVGMEEQIDLVVCRAAASPLCLRAEEALSSLCNQLKRRGLIVTWAPAAEIWLDKQIALSACDSARDIEVVLERYVTPLFMPYLDAGPDSGDCLHLICKGDDLRVDRADCVKEG